MPDLLGDLVASVTGLLESSDRKDELRQKFRLDNAIEAKIVSLFQDGQSESLSFGKIRKAIGGFDESQDELRRHLIRVGAARSDGQGESEVWLFRRPITIRQPSSRWKYWFPMTLAAVATIVVIGELLSYLGINILEIAPWTNGGRTFEEVLKG